MDTSTIEAVGRAMAALATHATASAAEFEHFVRVVDALDTLPRRAGANGGVAGPLGAIAARDEGFAWPDPMGHRIARLADAFLRARTRSAYEVCASVVAPGTVLASTPFDEIAARQDLPQPMRVWFALHALRAVIPPPRMPALLTIATRSIVADANPPMLLWRHLRRATGLRDVCQGICDAVSEGASLINALDDARAAMHHRVAHLRADAAGRIIIDVLAKRPVISVAGAAATIGRSFQAVNVAFAELATLGVVAHDESQRRHRVFYATAVIDAADARISRGP